ncbi:MAG: hypothetical protein HXY39_20915 [Chloroflexi bacterium]|nr:hypothetical protein [Chloroflexota bacterium]
MPGLFQSIADAVYREYDRRIKRASLITEYGATHHHGHEEDEDAGVEMAIVNLPPGAAIDEPHPVADATVDEQLAIEPLTSETPPPAAPAEITPDAIEAEIINAPPGAPLPRE